MAKFKPVYPFDSLHGKYATGANFSYRETFGRRHTYVLRHPYEGPASPAQTSMRQAWGIACKYCTILFRDPTIKAEWQARCAGTAYNRPDRFCVAELYRLFKSDPAELESAKAAVAADKKRLEQEQTALNLAKAQAEAEQATQQLSETELLKRQLEILSARVIDLESQLKSK